MLFAQQEFEVRCEWGEHGVAVLAPVCDVIVIVDVLSFSTGVDIAVRRGAAVFPYPRKDASAQAYADSLGAELAQPARSRTGYSLSPTSLLDIPPDTRLVLPSPNGATLAFAAPATTVLTGCLRNARAVAAAAQHLGRTIGVIPAGERWLDDHALRPCVEDAIGAGAIIQHLRGSRSPEAEIALAAWCAAEADLETVLRQCSSGKELIAKGFENDVFLASQLDVSTAAPVLTNHAFARANV